MPHLFILNPRSGHSSRALPAVRAYAAEHGADLALTAHPRHATALAAAAVAAGRSVIIAVGGDGTLNEVASALVDTPAALGLVPCGSGNGLGRHLGIHGSVPRALAIIRAGHTRLIDTGVADGHPFFTAAGLGFEAEISSRFNRLVRRGFLRYLRTSATACWGYRPQSCVIEGAGARLTRTAFTLAVCNSDQYGNHARIAPGACIDDGLLDLTVVPPLTAFNFAPLLVRLFSGSLHHHRAITRLRSTHFTVERPAPGLIHTDGELHDAPARVTFQVRAASLRILAPA